MQRLDLYSSNPLHFAGNRLALLFGLFIGAAAGDGFAQPTGAQFTLTETQIRRGQALRALLTKCVDFASAHTNRWPKDLHQLGGQIPPDVNYVATKALNRGLGASYRVGAVCHERLEAHLDGVWVGYVDSHLEFVRDAAALESALAQARLDQGWTNNSSASPSATSATLQPEAELQLKLVDDAGKPLAGAGLGTEATIDPASGNVLAFPGQEVASQASDNAGCISLRYKWLFSTNVPTPDLVPLIAFHPGRRLIGLRVVRPADFVPGRSKPGQALELKLKPGARVAGTWSCIDAPKNPPLAGARLSFLSVTGPTCLIRNDLFERAFEYLLPPGDYAISADANGTYGGNRLLHISDDAGEIVLHLDLAATRLSMLAGQPAPELRQLKGWTNGAPVTLKELRGNWVVLDFWHNSAWPRLPEIPDLIKLYDRFAAKGLVVIAIHDDSLASTEELGQRLASARRELWGGRALPFRVALDGGGQTSIPGTRIKVRGVTHALYGITGWPAPVLIDPQGRVVGGEQVPDIHARLEKVFGSARTTAPVRKHP